MVKMNNKKEMMEMDQDLVRKYQQGDKDAGALFINSHYAEIVKYARYHAHKTGYDFNLGNDMYNDCISEAVLAAYKAMDCYDFNSASVMTYINNKIMFEFLTLKRNNSKYGERFTAMSCVSSLETSEGNTIDISEILENTVDSENFEEVQLSSEMVSMVSGLLSQLDRESVEHKVLDQYYKALVNGHPHPVASVCQETGYTKQGVYNIIKRVARGLPTQMVDEIRDVLRAA